MAKDFSQKEKSEHENESDSEDEYSNESSGRDDICAGNADENDVSTSECISMNMFYFIITRRNRTRLAEKMQKNILSMSLNHNY